MVSKNVSVKTLINEKVGVNVRTLSVNGKRWMYFNGSLIRVSRDKMF